MAAAAQQAIAGALNEAAREPAAQKELTGTAAMLALHVRCDVDCRREGECTRMYMYRERDEQHVVAGMCVYVCMCVCVGNRGQLGLVQAVPSSETN